MTDGGRPVDEVSDDTDVLPIALLPAAPPIQRVLDAPATPAPAPTPMAAQPGELFASPAQGGYSTNSMPARKRGSNRAARLLVLLLLALLIGLVGLIAAVASGLLSYADLVRLAGLGPGEIVVQNLRDDAVAVTASRVDGRGSVISSNEARVEAADIRVYPNMERGPWDVAFVAADGSSLGTCHLEVAGNGAYTFMVLPELVVVARTGQVPATADDFVLGASSMCRGSGQ